MMDDLYSWLAKSIPYRGDFDKFLRGKWFQNGMLGIGYALSVLGDISEGAYDADVLKNLGVNGIDLGTNVAIGATQVGAVVLLVNGVVQLGGNLELGIQKVTAGFISTDDEMRDILLADADRKGDALDRMDLGNVTKEFGETVYDVYLADSVEVGKAAVKGFWDLAHDPSYDNLVNITNSLNQLAREKQPSVGEKIVNVVLPGSAMLMDPRGREGLRDTGKAALNVVDGLADYVVSGVGDKVNRNIAFTSKTVDVLPLDDNLKHAVNETAKDMMEASQDVFDGVVDFVSL